jgi:NADPH:quinone reductase-like Zn-dependent oxidoreductase
MTLQANREVLIRRAGRTDRLQLVDALMLKCAAGEVVIRNEAVGVGFADVLIREGLYPGVPLPATPGGEVVGIVVSKGRAVELRRARCRRVGDRRADRRKALSAPSVHRRQSEGEMSSVLRFIPKRREPREAHEHPIQNGLPRQ